MADLLRKPANWYKTPDKPHMHADTNKHTNTHTHMGAHTITLH